MYTEICKKCEFYEPTHLPKIWDCQKRVIFKQGELRWNWDGMPPPDDCPYSTEQMMLFWARSEDDIEQL